MRAAKQRSAFRLATTLLVIAAVVACAPVPPAGGLSRPAAFTAAKAAQPDATGVVSGEIGQIRDFDPNQAVVPDDLWVWAVVVSGSFPFSCGPIAVGRTQPPCPPPGKTKTVLLDYRTGEFIEAFGTSGS